MSSIVQYLPETLSVTLRVLDGPEKKRTLVRKPGVVQAKGLLLRLENGREIYLLHAYNNYVTHNNVRDGYCDYPRDSFEVLRHLFVEGHESSLGHLLQRFTPEEVAKIGTVATVATGATGAPEPAAAAVAAPATTSTLSVPPQPSLPLALTFHEKVTRLPARIPVTLRVGEAPAKAGTIQIEMDCRVQPPVPTLLENSGVPLRVFFNDYLKTSSSETAKAAFWATDIEMLKHFFVEHPTKVSLGTILESWDEENFPMVGVVPPPQPPPMLVEDTDDDEETPVLKSNLVIIPPPVAAVTTVPKPLPDSLDLTEQFREIEKTNLKRLKHPGPVKLDVDLDYDHTRTANVTLEVDGTFTLVTSHNKTFTGLNSLEVLYHLSYKTERMFLHSRALCQPFYGLEKLYYEGARRSIADYVLAVGERERTAAAKVERDRMDAALVAAAADATAVPMKAPAPWAVKMAAARAAKVAAIVADTATATATATAAQVAEPTTTTTTTTTNIYQRLSVERKKSRKLHAELAAYAQLEKQINYNKGLEARLAVLKASLG
jgi:hypothetical protein